MTIEQINLISKHIKACLKRLTHLAQVTVAELLDCQLDQATLDGRVWAMLESELVPEPWNRAWDM